MGKKRALVLKKLGIQKPLSLRRVLDISDPSISLLDLQLFRILFCSSLLYISLAEWGKNLSKYGNFPSWHPIPLFEVMGVERISVNSLEIFYALMAISFFMVVVGWKTRFWLIISCGLFFYVHGHLLGLTKSPDSNYVYHSKNSVVFILLILAMDRRINLLSGISNIFRRPKELLNEKISSHSMFLVVLMLGFVYFGASYVRIKTSGLQWMDGYTLKSYFFDAYIYDGSELALWLSKQHHISQVISILTMLFESTFLLVFLFFRPYFLLGIAGVLFHTSIYFVMKIDFLSYYGFSYLVFLFFFPICLADRWVRVVAFLKKKFLKGAISESI